MIKKFIFLVLLFFITLCSYSQNVINGTINELDNKNNIVGLPGATIQWLGTTTGTSTNGNGEFLIQKIVGNNKLLVKHISYQPDTIIINESQLEVKILLTGGKQLNEVVIKNNDGFLFSIKPIATQIITNEGLKKAACCSLAESFESSATVDIEYSDAVSGAKQIQMLGLAGVYSQTLIENMPFVRGLSTPFGLSYVPGPWMEAIYVSKGTSSVVNGYESITGQINVEYKKPESNEEKLYINLYGDNMGRSEINLNSRLQVKNNVSSMLLLHAENQAWKIDHNHDHFLDIPQNQQINVMNRWDYDIPHKLEGKAVVSFLSEDRTGGNKNFDKEKKYLGSEVYGLGIKNNRFNATTKNGFFLKGEEESIGTQLSFTHHENNSYFGQTTYKAIQSSFYANFIYANRIKNSKKHKISTGFSYQMDSYNEKLNDSSFSHTESVPGIYSQYSYSLGEAIAIIIGFRADYHNQYGLFWTPRLHLKYMLNETWSVRGTIGKGYRVTNIYAENTSLLTSSRKFVISEKLNNEEAWNFGVNLLKKFTMNKKDASISLDYYRTDFVNQVIVDVDQNSHYAYLYNLKGVSYSNSTQIEAIIYPIKRFEAVIAYRFNDVKQTINGKLQNKPMTSQHKAILTLSYKTKFDKWQFDLTTQYHGAMRLPDLSSNPLEYQLSKHSPDYTIFNSQITRRFKNLDIYVGAENIGDFKQKTPIIASHDPFGQYFDSSIVWGPIKGRMFYAGLRLTLK